MAHGIFWRFNSVRSSLLILNYCLLLWWIIKETFLLLCFFVVDGEEVGSEATGENTYVTYVEGSADHSSLYAAAAAAAAGQNL